MNDLTVIERDGIRVLTTQQLAEVYGTQSVIIRNNFNRNKDRYILGKHYIALEGEEKTEFLNRNQIDSGLKNAQTIYLWTEKGAFLAAKSLNTDKAWEAYDHLIDGYFTKKASIDISKLPPELQLFSQMFEAQKRIALAQQETEERINKVEKTQEVIKTAVIPVKDNWRQEVVQKFKRIVEARKCDYRDLWVEMYNELDARAGTNTALRLENRRRRMKDDGKADSLIKKLNRLDIIEDDKKLREILSKILSEQVIRYC